MISISLDNGKTWQPAPDGVAVNISDVTVPVPRAAFGEVRVTVDADGVTRELLIDGAIVCSDNKDITDTVEELSDNL